MYCFLYFPIGKNNNFVKTYAQQKESSKHFLIKICFETLVSVLSNAFVAVIHFDYNSRLLVYCAIKFEILRATIKLEMTVPLNIPNKYLKFYTKLK